MQMRKQRAGLPALLAFFLTLTVGGVAAAQETDSTQRQTEARGEINHEVQLHLLLTSDGVEGGAKVPQALDGIVRQLKTSLPAADYRLAATFINRVRDGGVLEVKSAGGAPFGGTQQESLTPSFFQLSLNGVKLIDGASGQKFVNIQHFRLGMKVPIQTAVVSGEKGAAGYPVIQYEDTGLTTQLSVREGEPTLVGTLNTSRPNQLFILVITVKRTNR